MDALSKLFEAIESRNEQRNGENSATPEDLRARLHSLLNAQTFRFGTLSAISPDCTIPASPIMGSWLSCRKFWRNQFFPPKPRAVPPTSAARSISSLD